MTRIWTSEEVEALNFYLRNKWAVEITIKDGECLYTDHNIPVSVPADLEIIQVYPLWMKRVIGTIYYILCASMPSSLIDHWLCSYSGSLMTEERSLKVLFHIKEWAQYEIINEPPKAKKEKKK